MAELDDISSTWDERPTDVDESFLSSLAKRINIGGSGGRAQQDPWDESAKYALGWVYFSIILLAATFLIRLYHIWGDKVRTALHKEVVSNSAKPDALGLDYEMGTPTTNNSQRKLFPSNGPVPEPQPEQESSDWTISWLNYVVSFTRWIFYRPVPVVRIRKLAFVPPSLATTVVVLASLLLVILYSVIPQPYFYDSIRDGSPPLAIRSGMLAVAMIPWIVALSTKANLVSFITGIGHERLNVLHRWGAYICLVLSLIHTIPFYVTPVWEDGALHTYRQFIKGDFYIYGSGIAALAPLCVLCLHSLPFLRHRLHQLFVTLHFPIAFVFVGMMFWHCNNFLTSWHYLYATVGIWLVAVVLRICHLNWVNPFRLSWLIGDESAVTLLPENAVKVTIPTQVRWRPGQHVYLRMPGVSFFENHPFTIASLCSDDFPSSYGEKYRDMTLVFRPFGGFTNKILETALTKGPFKTYRSFIEGPYGGMRRDMASFDHVIFFAGGSGITAIASQLLDLIKRMRDGKALTRTVRVVWALKRPETMEWFKEELRICREYAPPGSLFCEFYLTGAKRYGPWSTAQPEVQPRPHSGVFNDRINDMFQGVASKRNSAYIREVAEGDEEREKELRRENEDGIAPLPVAHVAPQQQSSHVWDNSPVSPAQFNGGGGYHHNNNNNDGDYITTAAADSNNNNNALNFGFPSTPTMFQKNLMRFAFLPSQRKDGWRTEYGRPDIPFMLRQFAQDFGKRTCVFVCGPPGMRVDVSRSVARLQRIVMADREKEELFLHAENYAI